MAGKITGLFGLTVKSPLAECHPGRWFLSAEKGQGIVRRVPSESRLLQLFLAEAVLVYRAALL